MSDQDAFWTGGPGAPGGESDVRNGRYQLPDPETGEARSWTRASNLGAPLADRFGLERWKMRRLLWGLGQRSDVVRLLLAMTEPDAGKLDELIATALEAAAHTESANLGSLIHEVQRRVDEGLEVPEGEERYAEGYRAALEREGLTMVCRECRVINRALGAAGRLDGIAREADGTLVVVDTKSTDHLTLAAPEIAPQLAGYATADWIEPNGDGKGWVRMPEVRRDYAVAVHVDRGTGAVSLYRVDLFLGAYGANLAEQVREYRKLGKSIMLPYVRPVGLDAGRASAEPAAGPFVGPERHLSAVPDPAPTEAKVAMDNSAATLTPTDDPFSRAAGTHPADGAAVVHEQVTLHGTDERGNPRFTPSPTLPAGGSRLLSAAELTKLTKAQVQEYARKVDPEGVGRDLAHQKAVLIQMLGKAGRLADQSAPTRPAGADPAVISGPVNGSDPTDPMDPAFEPTVLRWIGQAETVAQLGAVHQRVLRLGGDQAWTDVMAEQARARANGLDAANPNHSALSRVVACRSQEDVAALWDELTVGGSRPEGWPAEVDAAARERVRQIEAQAPPAPANPFGPTGPAVN